MSTESNITPQQSPSESENSDSDHEQTPYKLRQRSSKSLNQDNYTVNLEGDRDHKWSNNDIVWAKYDDFPWWPAQVISYDNRVPRTKSRRRRRKPRTILCQWFGEGFEAATNCCKLENVVRWDPEDMDRIFVDVNEEDVSLFEDSCEEANKAYLELCEQNGNEPLKSAINYGKKIEKAKIDLELELETKSSSNKKRKRRERVETESSDDEYHPDDEPNTSNTIKRNTTTRTRSRRRRTPTDIDAIGPPPLETMHKTQPNDETISEPPTKRIRLSANDDEKQDINEDEEDEHKESVETTESTEESTGIFNGNDPWKMKVKELKELCRIRGLKVGGNKATLIKRLLNPDIADSKRKGGFSVNTVHDMLKSVGITEPNRVSNCLKKGIQRGYYTIDPSADGLDVLIHRGECLSCGKSHNVTMRDCLYQQDYGGNDYEDGGEGGATKCEDCMGMYVTGLCEGNPQFDSGKFHNHCCECPGFGMCIGDYREAHCEKCGKHYWAGFMGEGTCDNCSRRTRAFRGGFGWFGNDEEEDDCVIQ